MRAFVKELRNRKVFRAGLAYAVVAWLLIQVVATVEGALNLPDWSDTLVITLLVIGFPIAIAMAWAFDVTPEGIRRTQPQIAADPAALEKPEEPASEMSIAVLPFVNMSSDPEQEYFSDGVSEELLNQLVTLKGLHVAGRTSSFAFKGRNDDIRVIGNQLKVAHVLEGSVRKAGNRVRITAQLIKVADGYHLWSKTFDRDLDDIFAIQDETARAVADALSIVLGIDETNQTGSTTNAAAYDAYLAGLAKGRERGRPEYQQASDRFEEAVALDPEFADAWAWLAEIYDYSAHTFMSERGDLLSAKSRDAASRAIAIAPDSPASLRASALLAMRDRDWVGAERFWLKALKAVPGDASANDEYGTFLLYVGRPGDAVTFKRRAVGIDPLSLSYNLELAVALQINGEPEKALRQYRHTAELPGNKDFLHALLVVLGMEQNDRALMDESLAALFSGNPADQHPSERITRVVGPLLDAPREALAELRKFDREPVHDNPLGRAIIAVWASHFGDDELALEQFRSLAAGRVGAYFIVWRPIQKRMRQLPGFKDLLRELGLVDYWQASGRWGDFCRPLDNGDFEVVG